MNHSSIEKTAEGYPPSRDIAKKGANYSSVAPSQPNESVSVALDFWSFADLAKDSFGRLWPGINSEASFLVMTLHRATDMILFDVRQIEEDYGLSPAAQRALYVLAICGPIPILRLAELSGMSKAACSSVVRTLQAEQYVTRTRAEGDGRSYVVSITDSGRRVAEQTFRERNTRESRWLNVLTRDETEQLHKIFEKLMLFAGDNAEKRDSL